MSEIMRFGVSLEKELLDQFDSHISEEGYSSRSEAIKDLIRKELIQKEWIDGKDVAGTITFVYDHHKRDLVGKLMDIQHDYHNLIISNQHVHLDHNNCLEVIVSKGEAEKIKTLSDRIRAFKGVKDCHLAMTTIAQNIE